MGNPNITICKHRQKNCLASIWIDFENNISWCSPKSWLNFDEGNSRKFAEQTYLFWFHATKSILYGGLDRLKWVRGFWILRFLLHKRHWPLKSWANFHWDKLYLDRKKNLSNTKDKHKRSLNNLCFINQAWNYHNLNTMN